MTCHRFILSNFAADLVRGGSKKCRQRAGRLAEKPVYNNKNVRNRRN